MSLALENHPALAGHRIYWVICTVGHITGYTYTAGEATLVASTFRIDIRHPPWPACRVGMNTDRPCGTSLASLLPHMEAVARLDGPLAVMREIEAQSCNWFPWEIARWRP